MTSTEEYQSQQHDSNDQLTSTEEYQSQQHDSNDQMMSTEEFRSQQHDSDDQLTSTVESQSEQADLSVEDLTKNVESIVLSNPLSKLQVSHTVFYLSLACV